MFKNTVFKSLTTLFKSVLFGILLVATAFTYSSTALATVTSLETLLGPKAYNYLKDYEGFNQSKWRYLELIAIKVQMIDTIAQTGEYIAEWDNTYIAQTNLLNHLTAMAPMAEEASDLVDIIRTEDDNDMVLWAKEELVEHEEELYAEANELLQDLWDIALPVASGNIMVEVLPPQNYPESPISIGALAKFYENLAEGHGWNFEILSYKENDKNAGSLIEGGYPLSHAFIRIRGLDAYRKLFLESGTHRFIFTDSDKIGASTRKAKTHTTYADVRIYVTPRRDKFHFKESDVEFQFTRSSGNGGQHVNTTDSAVRATHKPTGITVFVQQERKQIQNRKIAIEMIKAKLFTMHIEEQEKRRQQARNSSIEYNSENMSPYVRTYHFTRDPVETRALLRGQSRPNTYDRWDEYLSQEIDLLSNELSQAIQSLYTEYIQNMDNTGINAGLSEALMIESHASGGTCGSVLGQ